jgi:hypothetical protein
VDHVPNFVAEICTVPRITVFYEITAWFSFALNRLNMVRTVLKLGLFSYYGVASVTVLNN